jgi:hypothetical protein
VARDFDADVLEVMNALPVQKTDVEASCQPGNP